MSRQILAIDIRNDVIAAVLVNTGLKLCTVARTATVELLPPSEGEDPLVQALMHLKEKIDPGTANIVVALPADGVHYRKLPIPFKEDNKIRQVLPFELEPLMPVDIDHLKLGFHKNHALEKTEVLAVAIDKSLLERYTDALTAANIRPQLIVPGGLPLATYAAGTEELTPRPRQLLIIDVESEKSTLFAVQEANIEIVRRLSSATDSEQAAEALALRIRQTLTAMSDYQNDVIAPEKVYLTGPGLKHSVVSQRISLALELPSENMDLTQWAPRLELAEGAVWIPSLMCDALALALLEAEGRPCANFHRTSSPLRNYWTTYRPYIMGPAVLLAIALFIGFSGVIIDNYYLNKRVRALDEKIKQVYLSVFPDSQVNAPPLDLMKSKINALKKGDSSSGPNPAPIRTIDALLQLSQLIPESIDVVLTQMTMGGAAVTIAGEAGDFNSVDDIKSRVEKGALFKTVTIAAANMDKSGKKVRFKLKIDL